MKNRGKQFEDRFKKDFEESVPNSTIFRLADQISYLKETSRNPCDFICFANGFLYLTECKSTHASTFNFNKLKQYDKLLPYSKKWHVHPIVVIWFEDYDEVLIARIDSIKKMKDDGLKSINVAKTDRNMYNIITVPSIKLRVFLKSDYTCIDKLKGDW